MQNSENKPHHIDLHLIKLTIYTFLKTHYAVFREEFEIKISFGNLHVSVDEDANNWKKISNHGSGYLSNYYITH
jgi:hypothetical protein